MVAHRNGFTLSMATSKLHHPKKQRNAVTLKAVATHLGLTPGTVSAVLNDSAAARSIPEHTRKRILAAGSPEEIVSILGAA